MNDIKTKIVNVIIIFLLQFVPVFLELLRKTNYYVAGHSIVSSQLCLQLFQIRSLKLALIRKIFIIRVDHCFKLGLPLTFFQQKRSRQQMHTEQHCLFLILIIYISVLSVFICLHAHVQDGAHGDQKSMPSTFFNCTSFSFLRQDLLLNLKLTNLTRLDKQQALANLLSLPLNTGIYH